MLESMNLFGSTKSKITKDKNGENMPTFKITEVVLVHSNIVTTTISKIKEYYIDLFLIYQLVNY